MKTKIFLISLILILNSTNLFSQFGKNKVQYREYTWKYIQTDHFDIYYDDGNKYLAEFTAFSAEKALNHIEEDIAYELPSRVTLIVYESHNDFQQTNVISQFMPEGVGGVTELFKNRVVVPFMGDYSELDHVVHHELMHAVLNEMFYGGTFQTAISTSGGFMIPLWMNEGLCEYSSIGGLDTETDMYMRDIAISEKLPSLERMGGFMAYRGGQTFYWYVAKEYGAQKVPELINRLLVTRNVDRAFQAAFGMGLEEFSEEWENDIKKMYWPDLEIYQSLKDFSVRVTDREEENNFYNSSPAISPDGERMAYISAPEGIFGVYIREIDDPDTEEELVSSFRQQDFEDLNLLTPGISWNPSGDKIAISAKAGGNDAVFIVDVETEKYEKYVFDIRSITSVEWSPDGKSVAFIGSVGSQSDIYLYNLEKKTLKNLTNDVFSDQFPTWSPDSKSIYFISDRQSYARPGISTKGYEMWNQDVYSSDIYSINLDNSQIRRLTFDSQNHKTSLAVSPDNETLFYVSDRNGIGNVYRMKIESLDSRPITNSLNGISQISLARDASKMLFATQVDAGFDIFMLRFPLDINLEIDELPLTKFKKQSYEQELLVDKIIEEAKKEKVEEQELSGYGEFELDFSQQKVVKPNEDAAKENTSIGSDSKEVSGDEISDEVNGRINDEFVENDYKINFSPDIVTGNPGFNTWFGVQGITQMVFSDELGDHQIFVMAGLNRDIANSQLYFTYNYLPNIIDYSFSGYHYAVYVNDEVENSGGLINTFRFRNFGTKLQAQRPFSLFNRVEAGVDLMFLSRDNIIEPGLDEDSKFMVVPEARYVFDNTLNGYYGPREGSRYFVGARYSPALGSDGVGFTTFMSDFRYYLPLFGGYYTIALRGTGAVSTGSSPQEFYLGGLENWINRDFQGGQLPFDEPEDFAYLNFQTPLRGWQVAEVTGSKFAVVNAEFRFPMFTALVAGPIPILIQGVMGNIFLDVGAAWDDDFNPVVSDDVLEKNPRDPLSPLAGRQWVNDYQNLMISTGTGVRSYILGLPLKVDVAWRLIGDSWTQPFYLFSLGFDF